MPERPVVVVVGATTGQALPGLALFLHNLGRFVRSDPLRNLVDAHAGFGVG